MSNKQITIILTGLARGRSYRITLSRAFFWLALIAEALVLLGLVVSFAMYGRAAVVADRADSLARENARLAERTQRVVALQQEVDRLRSMEAKVLALMGVDTLAVGRGRWEDLIEGGGVADSTAESAGDGFIWPVTGVISRGYRPDGDSGTPHLGLDIAGETGAPIKAIQDGVVTFAGGDSVFGNAVIIDHGGGVSSLYGHNSKLLVGEGDSVKRGQVIARLGSTGRSSAPHLHLEIREGKSAVDPLKYLGKRE